MHVQVEIQNTSRPKKIWYLIVCHSALDQLSLSIRNEFLSMDRRIEKPRKYTLIVAHKEEWDKINCRLFLSPHRAPVYFWVIWFQLGFVLEMVGFRNRISYKTSNFWEHTAMQIFLFCFFLRLVRKWDTKRFMKTKLKPFIFKTKICYYFNFIIF